MVQRILSTVLLWALLGGSLWFFRTPGALVIITLISALTLREFYQLMRGAGYDPFDKFGVGVGVLVTLAPWLEARLGWPMGMVLPLAVVVCAVRLLGERTPETRVEALATTLFGLVYVSLMLSFLVAILVPRPGEAVGADARLLLALWLVAVAKFCDVGALLAGLAFGRHRMSPQISPKKTWEGAAGGILCSMGIGAAVAWLARDVLGGHLTPGRAALIAVPVAGLGIVADLVESVIKRRANLKDSGHAIPGIGGMFDLSDSMILAAPVGYLLLGLA